MAVLAVFAHARVSGAERVPPAGGLLVVSNHLSFADPEIVMAVTPRPLTFMAKEELFGHWYARLLAHWTGATFPVRRGKRDIRAVRDALDLIEQGAAVVVFAEGTRHPEGLGAAYPGVSYLATRAGCPVLPIALVGTESIETLWSLRHRPSFEVRFGEPFSVEPIHGGGEEIATEIMMRIAALLPPERRGVYAASTDMAVVG